MERRDAWGVAAIAAATLLLETTLTRLLAVAQFYHFAFLVVSVALLGFGASGALLSVFPALLRVPTGRMLTLAGAGFAASTALAYAAVNLLPLDSYSIAWDRRQILYLVLYYLALTLPFLSAGLGIGAALASQTGRSHRIYAANLFGSAAGAMLAPAALALAGVPGAMLLAMPIGLLPLILETEGSRKARAAGGVAIFGCLLCLGGLAALNVAGRGALGLTLSPYKGLSHALRYPGSESLYGRWSAVARADLLGNAGTRQLPGLSYTYDGPAPDQLGLSLDADSLQPVPLTAPSDFSAAAFLPESIAFDLRPGARALVLEPAGGLAALQALAGGADSVTVVSSQPIALDAARAAPGGGPFVDPRIRAVTESARGFIAGHSSRYDVVFVPLTDSYRPVASGAYSLAETYNATVEALTAALPLLEPNGMLVMSRWVQSPPSEDLRILATLREALRRNGADPDLTLVAFRGIQTVTVLAKLAPWTADELSRLRTFAEARRYDLVAAPGLQPDETNRYNQMPSPDLYLSLERLKAVGSDRFYSEYPYIVEPATDDKPFFFHFFRWGQTRQIVATLGRTWQPFGGSGYLILFVLLALVTALSAALILAPLLLLRREPASGLSGVNPARILLYFGLLGVAFLFVEIPLIQRWMLVTGHATYAFAGVVAILLVGSGFGSLLARRIALPRRLVLFALAFVAAVLALLGGRFSHAALAWPEPAQWVALIIMLTPLAILMGLPFPWGLAYLERRAPRLTAMAWAVNGCASVIASVAAAILTIGAGFTAVILLGAAAYAFAALLLPAAGTPAPALPASRA